MDGRGLARVERDEHGDGLLGTLLQERVVLAVAPIRDPSCESLDKVRFTRREFFFFPAKAAT